jgi:hypothetical protein
MLVLIGVPTLSQSSELANRTPFPVQADPLVVLESIAIKNGVNSVEVTGSVRNKSNKPISVIYLQATCISSGLAKTIDFTIGVETVKKRVFSRLTNQYETRDFVETQITFPGYAFEFRRELPDSENVLACSKVVVTGWVDAANELR